jgi:hypothetical protein
MSFSCLAFRPHFTWSRYNLPCYTFILSRNAWERQDEEIEDGKYRKQQFASSVVKLDKLSLRDVVFNVIVVLDIGDYTQKGAIKYKPPRSCVVSCSAKLCTLTKHVCSLCIAYNLACLFLIIISSRRLSRISWLVFLLRILKVPVLNLGLETVCLNWDISICHDTSWDSTLQ